MYLEVYFKTKILNFNENSVVIPNDISGMNFKVNSAICFEPTNEKKPSSGGHYTTWTRVKNHVENWIHISDTQGTSKNEFISHLKDVSIECNNKKYLLVSILVHCVTSFIHCISSFLSMCSMHGVSSFVHCLHILLRVFQVLCNVLQVIYIVLQVLFTELQV